MANELVLEGGVWKLKEEAPAITNASIDPDYLPSTTRTLASGSSTIPIVLQNTTSNPSVVELNFSGSYLKGISPDSGSTENSPTYGIDPDINVPSSGSIRTIYLRRNIVQLSGSQTTETVYFSGSSGLFTSRNITIEGEAEMGNIVSSNYGSSAHPISTATSNHKVLRVNPAGGVRYVNDLPNSTFAFTPIQPFTMALWYKSTQSIGSSAAGIISSATTSSPYKGVLFWTSSNNQIYLLLRHSYPSDQLLVYSGAFSTSHQDGNWHHIAVTYDGSTNASGVEFYHNGSAVTGNTVTSDTLTSTDTLSIIGDSSYTFTFGPRYSENQRYLDYEIADFVMYDAEATAATIASLWNSGNGAFANTITPAAVGGGAINEAINYNFLSSSTNYVGWDISSNNFHLDRK